MENEWASNYAIITRMTEPTPQPSVWIDQPGNLKQLAKRFSGQPLLAVDTESNSLYAYQEQVCLIQFSDPVNDYLIDPIALPDLTALAPIFAESKIEKIFHAAEYDLICLKRDYEFQFTNIFDTMQAARILGRENVGLASMLESELGVKIEKKFQRANWGERPLPEAMVAYARVDSHYLIPLRNVLHGELERKGLLELAREDFKRVTRVAPGALEPEPPLYWRLPGSQALSQPQCGVLQALVEYRDRQARQANLPHFKVLSNDVLLSIATELPLTWDALADMPGLSVKHRDRHAKGLLAAVKRGLKMIPPSRPANHRRDDATLERMEILREWRKVTGRQLGVESDVVLPRDILEEIAIQAPANAKRLQTIMKDLPWRFDRFGSRILAAIHHKEIA